MNNNRVSVTDKHGKEIREFDVLKVFHYIGRHNKRHYIYKWVRKNERGELSIVHLDAPTEKSVPLSAVSSFSTWEDAEIVQSNED